MFKVANVIAGFNAESGGPPRTVAQIAAAGSGHWHADLFTTDYVESAGDWEGGGLNRSQSQSFRTANGRQMGRSRFLQTSAQALGGGLCRGQWAAGEGGDYGWGWVVMSAVVPGGSWMVMVTVSADVGPSPGSSVVMVWAVPLAGAGGSGRPRTARMSSW